jgi:hypothetical protein
MTPPKMSESSQTPTELPTLTLLPSKTNTPTLTPTFTPIPPGSILFQQDFEDGRMGGWDQTGGVWTVEQDPDGNRSLCGTGPSGNPPQISYRDRRTLWTDYAFETRVKFIQGNTLYITYRNDGEHNEHYNVSLNNYGLGLGKTWSLIGRLFPMTPSLDRWYIFKVEIKGDSLKLYVDNLLVEALTLEPPVIDHGGIGYVSASTDKLCLDNIKVWSLK